VSCGSKKSAVYTLHPLELVVEKLWSQNIVITGMSNGQDEVRPVTEDDAGLKVPYEPADEASAKIEYNSNSRYAIVYSVFLA
jgi:hypothetical protein